MNGCAPGLALIERLKATRKWAIGAQREKTAREKMGKKRGPILCALTALLPYFFARRFRATTAAN